MAVPWVAFVHWLEPVWHLIMCDVVWSFFILAVWHIQLCLATVGRRQRSVPSPCSVFWIIWFDFMYGYAIKSVCVCMCVYVCVFVCSLSLLFQCTRLRLDVHCQPQKGWLLCSHVAPKPALLVSAQRVEEEGPPCLLDNHMSSREVAWSSTSSKSSGEAILEEIRPQFPAFKAICKIMYTFT